jgi:hypothetical protein
LRIKRLRETGIAKLFPPGMLGPAGSFRMVVTTIQYITQRAAVSAHSRPCLEFLHLCCDRRIVDRSYLLHLADVILAHSALPEALNDVSDILQAGLQIRFRIPYPVSKRFDDRTTILPNSNRFTLVVGPFALDGVEGFPVLCGGGLPLNEEVGYLVQYAPYFAPRAVGAVGSL